jgi:hypothetical protein
MYLNTSVNINSIKEFIYYRLHNAPMNADELERQNIAMLAALACDEVLNASPDTTKAELNRRIAETLTSAIHGKDYRLIAGELNLPTEVATSADTDTTKHESVVTEDSYVDATSETNTIEETPAVAAPDAPVAEAPAPATKEKPNLITQLSTFLQLHYAFRYNIMTREPEMKRLDGDDNEYIVIGKREQNSIVISAQMDGLNCWDKDVNRIINSTETASYHPFVEYFDSLPQWDGCNRVDELAKRISEKEVWVNGFHRWMLGVAAQWMNYQSDNARANCVAPLLISSEQGWGKSTFCRLLMPAKLRRYYTESFDLTKESSCESKLAHFGLINMDEFDRFQANKMPLLKTLMQAKELNITLKYQQNATSLHRIASFIGTSNRRDLLTDNSGSRRFICVELEKEIDCTTPIDYEQLYAQLKYELHNGARTYFTKDEERMIQQNNRQFYHTTPEEEAFHRHFRMTDRTESGALFLTASEIFDRLKKLEPAVMRGVTAGRMSRLLPGLGTRVRTKLNNGYYVVER